MAAQNIEDPIRGESNGYHGFSCMQDVCVEAHFLKPSHHIQIHGIGGIWFGGSPDLSVASNKSSNLI